MKDPTGFPVFGWVGIPKDEVLSLLGGYDSSIRFKPSESISQLVRNSIRGSIQHHPNSANQSEVKGLIVETREEIFIKDAEYPPVIIVIFNSSRISIDVGFGISNKIDQDELIFHFSDFFKCDERLYLITKKGKDIECHGAEESAKKYLKSIGYTLK